MIRCIAIDDEPLALKQMVAYIEKTPFLELTGSFESALDAFSFLQSNSVDLMLVDINMPDLNGIEFVKALSSSAKFIFTTAHREYAVEGFQVDAADYLLKPIGYSDFLKSVNRAKERYFQEIVSQISTNDVADFIFVKSNYKIVRVNLSDIEYIESMREYVRIVLEDQVSITTLASMKSLEKNLPNDIFLRVHRSFIVNLNKIKTIDRNRIVFRKTYIPVSKQYQDIFQSFCDKKSLG